MQVSIIIPTYNRSDLLIEAVNSCLNQSYTDIEIIIVDDGSTDNTEHLILQRLQREWLHKNIKYYKQKNTGASGARNLGIKKANGEYIQFLDSDDLLHPEKLKLQIECFEKNEANKPEGCSCYGLLGKSFESKTNERIGIHCSTPLEYISRLCSRIVHGMQTSAPLWKASFIKAQLGWREDISFGDDLEYHIRLLSKANNIVFINNELFFVRVHEGKRLSVINFDKSKVTSSIISKKAIFKTLTEVNLWNEQTQSAFLSPLRTTYANILGIGDMEQINDFEKWILPLILKPEKDIYFLQLVLLRRIFGRKIILNLHGVLLNLRRI